MPTDITSQLLLAAAVIVIALILVGYLAKRRASQKSGYTLLSPATPLVAAALGRVRRAAAATRASGDAYLGAAPDGSKLSPAVSNIARSMARVEAHLARTPPSWANALQAYRSLFRGLAGSVQPAASSLVAAGREIHQKMARLVPLVPSTDDKLGEPSVRDAVAGDALIKMGGHVQSFAAAVHNLGVTLDLE